MQPSALSESPNSQVILLFMLVKPPTKQHLWAVLKFIFKGSAIVCCWLLTGAKREDFHADWYRKEKHVWVKQDEVGLQLVPSGNSEDNEDFGV